MRPDTLRHRRCGTGGCRRRPIAASLAHLAAAELAERCRYAVADARRAPYEAAEGAEALLRTARPLLAELREWRTGDADRAADTIAGTVLLVLTGYVTATGEVARARRILRQAVPLATTAALRRRLMRAWLSGAAMRGR